MKSNWIIGLCLACASSTLGCSPKLYDPQWATRPYPHELHTTNIADMHVFRRGTNIEIVNSTANSYADFDLWLNQRYVRRVESLPAGKTIRLSLWEFFDERGDRFNAGGLLRTTPPTPLRLTEIQSASGAPSQPLVGLVTIRAEEVVVPVLPQRR